MPPAKPGLRRRASLGALLLFLWSILAQPLLAQEGAISEEQVKAAILYNFVRFVEWPSSAFQSENTPLTIGVLGSESFANTLSSSLRDKKAHGRSFLVKKLNSASDAVNCQIVFVAREEARKTSQVTDAVKKHPILTVGETDDILSDGIIHLFKDDKNKLLFNINVAAAEESKLSISSHLLRLATKTLPRKEGGK
jgi:hypothetical protein